MHLLTHLSGIVGALSERKKNCYKNEKKNQNLAGKSKVHDSANNKKKVNEKKKFEMEKQ
jgi:hypothetical protein